MSVEWTRVSATTTHGENMATAGNFFKYVCLYKKNTDYVILQFFLSIFNKTSVTFILKG